MPFKEKIPGCFGSADKDFSCHFYDTERAREMLIEALHETTSWSEFSNAIKEFLEKEGCNAEHINKQMKNVQNLQYYFNND